MCSCAPNGFLQTGWQVLFCSLLVLGTELGAWLMLCAHSSAELHLSPVTGLNWLVVCAHKMLLSLPVAEVESSGSGWVSGSCHAGIPQYVRRFPPPRVCQGLGELESWVWKASQAVVPQSAGPCCECLCSCVCPAENVVDKVLWLLFCELDTTRVS